MSPNGWHGGLRRALIDTALQLVTEEPMVVGERLRVSVKRPVSALEKLQAPA
jgi:hypothetical protein